MQGMNSLSANQEIVIVTGASSGIGQATARELAQEGFHVLAGVRSTQDAEAIRTQAIEPVILDITNREHIQSLAARFYDGSESRTVRALVNNAGIGANAPFEVFPIEEWRRLFEVNFFGHVSITQALLPALIRSKGRIINVSSVGGKFAMATYGPYASTKFALEAVSDSLRRELAYTGVHVVVIEPGAVRTKIGDRAITTAKRVASTMTPQQNQRYGALLQAVVGQAASAMESGASPETAAKVLAKAVTVSKPRTRYAVGRQAALLPLLKVMPDRMVDCVLSAALHPYFPKSS